MDNDMQKVRRKDREQADDSFLKNILMNTASCSLAVIDQDGDPTNHVAFHVYDPTHHEVIVHMSKYGFFGEHIFNNKKICVSFYKSGQLYTASKASDFGCEYQSVVV